MRSSYDQVCGYNCHQGSSRWGLSKVWRQGVPCRANVLQRENLPQKMLLLPHVQTSAGLCARLWCSQWRHLLQRLLCQVLWSQRIWIWVRSWLPSMWRCVSYFANTFHQYSWRYALFSDSGAPDRPTLAINTSSIRGDPSHKDTCPRCGGLVFHAERMLSKNNVIHLLRCWVYQVTAVFYHSLSTKTASLASTVSDPWTRRYAMMLQMGRFFANFATARISGPKATVTAAEVCQPCLQANPANSQRRELSKIHTE